MITHELYDDGTRRWTFLGRDPGRPDEVIDTNQYVVMHRGKAALLDPGGVQIFPAMAAALARQVDFSDVELIFASHQDPDIVSSLSLWLDLCPHLDVHVSWVWGKFIPHFGGNKELKTIPDEGGFLPLGGSRDLSIVPAHYVHASGSNTIYDPRAKLLFSADIGAALLPPGMDSVFVEDFDQHVQYMEAFHRRWLPSNVAKNDWIARVRELDVELLCPQHGALFRGDDVGRFLDWLEALEVGSAVRTPAVA